MTGADHTFYALTRLHGIPDRVKLTLGDLLLILIGYASDPHPLFRPHGRGLHCAARACSELRRRAFGPTGDVRSDIAVGLGVRSVLADVRGGVLRTVSILPEPPWRRGLPPSQ